jgi:hypothetical protein
MRPRGNDGCVGRDDDNKGFAGWALPTVFQKSCWDDAYVGQKWLRSLFALDTRVNVCPIPLDFGKRVVYSSYIPINTLREL